MMQGLSGGSTGIYNGRYSGYWNTGKGSTCAGSPPLETSPSPHAVPRAVLGELVQRAALFSIGSESISAESATWARLREYYGRSHSATAGLTATARVAMRVAA